MNNKIKLVTTTSSIEGWSIEKYFGLVSYQLVIGANIFQDIFASFRDIFGGIAKGYQKELQKMEEIALDNLKKKASQLGANLILGLRLDFDDVSGGGKSMFMLSVSGTAAFGKTDKENTTEDENELISFNTLNFEIEKETLKEIVLVDSYSIQSIKEIEQLLEYKIEIIDKVISYIDINLSIFNNNKDLIIKYFINIPKKSINNVLKSNLFLSIKKETFIKLLEILEIIDWFDYDVILYLLKSNDPIAHNRVLYLLEYENEYYSKDDISRLNQIIKLLCTTFQNYPILKISKGLFGQENEEWECLNCGTKNSKNLSICSRHDCQANIYGIPNDEINPEKLKNTIAIKINKLKQLLSIT